MGELVVIIWTIVAFVFGFGFMFLMKKRKRALGKYMMIYMLLNIVLVFIISGTIYYFLYPSVHLIWTVRLSFLCLGILNAWLIFKRPWTKRDVTDYTKDSLLAEGLFFIGASNLLAIAFITAPQTFTIVPYSVELSRPLWDLPILFFLPYFFVKLLDFGGQVPFKNFENPYVFNIEPENPKNWPWRDLMQVNFEVKKSLIDEYDLFTWKAEPWIEAPKEVSIGSIFRLIIQERRNRNDLTSIQDMGDEYDGQSNFWWSFKVKFVWYKPNTWRRSPRYVNPDLSVAKNKIKKGDVIVAKRIPGIGKKSNMDYHDIPDDDMAKTVIIKR